ncbi:MAG: hypothetical protein U1F15_13735 [Burkholderiales bacterium]
MTAAFLLRPLPLALVAIATVACGSAFAAEPAMPDVPALIAQAKEHAKRSLDDAMLLAFDEELLALPPSMAFVASEFGPPREIVKNAPYTAEAVTESIQVLADGNRIVRKSTTLLARDGAGRTRQERKGEGRGSVFIYDPMEGRSVVLNDSARTAMRLPRVPGPPSPPEAAPPAPGAGSLLDGQPGRAFVRRSREAGDGPAPEDVRVEVVRMGRDHGAGPLPPLTLPMMPRGKGETTSLGTRDFDGVKADGTMTTHTIPAGEIGNEKPIVVTRERWFSPELHVVVYAKSVDPRAGETIYRLTGVKRGEPPAELFRIPAEYRMRGEGRRS